MTFLAGERLTAQRVNRLQTKPYIAAASSALAVANTTYADIPGATITLTTETDNAAYTAYAVFDASVTTTSTTILMVGRMQLDGVTVDGIAVYGMDTADRACVKMQWQGTIAAAGSHTFKLQGALTNTLASGGSFLQDDTKIQVNIFEVV